MSTTPLELEGSNLIVSTLAHNYAAFKQTPLLPVAGCPGDPSSKSEQADLFQIVCTCYGEMGWLSSRERGARCAELDESRFLICFS